ncbi:hypothetical protein AHAS_Ahas03G0245000 [Arachis hypogaea]
MDPQHLVLPQTGLRTKPLISIGAATEPSHPLPTIYHRIWTQDLMYLLWPE